MESHSSEMNVIFSVIVPVYNVEDYVEKCLDSLLRQKDVDPDDYEIIVVDDGSTDNSSQICDRYAAAYDRVHVFHKENGGLSDARNYGVKYAQGEYLLFIDSDDYVSGSALAECKKRITETRKQGCVLDVIIADGQFFDREGRIRKEIWFDRSQAGGERLYCTGQEMLDYTLSVRCNWAAWGKYFRREYWEEQRYEFKYGRYSEDMQFIDRVVWEARYASMIPAFVCYRYRDNSIVHSVTLGHITSIVDNLSDWEQYFSEKTMPAGIEKAISQNLAYSYVNAALAHVYDLRDHERELALKAVGAKTRWLKHMKGMPGIILRGAVRITGVKHTCKALAAFKSIRRKFS